MQISRELRYELKQLRRKFKGPVFQVLVALVFSLISVAFFVSVSGIRLELSLLQKYFEARGPVTPPHDVIIVSIDDESYRTLEASTNYPLPRRYIATALEAINSAKPKILILDAKIPQERLIDPEADARIEAALRAGPATIFSGEIGQSRLTLPSDERFRKAAKMELPMTLYSAAGLVAYVSNPSAPEQPDTSLYERVWFSKPLLELGGIQITPPGRFDLINFYGPANTITRISLHELATKDPALFHDRLHNKIVLMGYQSLQYGKGVMGKDEFLVPVSGSGMFGVEIHAHVLGNLLEQSWLKRMNFQYELLFVVLTTFFVASVLMRAPHPLTVGIVVALETLLFVVGYSAFRLYGLWIPGLTTIAVASSIAIVVSAIYFFSRSQAYRRYLERTFSFEREREL